MTGFIRPKGTNFRCADALTAKDLAKALCCVARFLQEVEPYEKLERYDDWWEHDGLHFDRASVDFNQLFAMINSPRALLESVPGDEHVFVGVAPVAGGWYLRFRVEWDDEGCDLLGCFDITVPESLVEQFRTEVVRTLSLDISEQDADSYYAAITVSSIQPNSACIGARERVFTVFEPCVARPLTPDVGRLIIDTRVTMKKHKVLFPG
jgi:hypothetical protein